ncbi:MAG: PH domain-containing protein, partial [Haloarculaceae archaeon]
REDLDDGDAEAPDDREREGLDDREREDLDDGDAEAPDDREREGLDDREREDLDDGDAEAPDDREREDLYDGDAKAPGDRERENLDDGAGELAAGGRSELDEHGPVRTLNARVRLKWYGQVLLAVAILAAIGLGVSIAVDPVEPWMVAAVVVPLLAIGLLWVSLRYRLWAFQFRSDHLFLERGVYRHVETAVPYVRIQHVDTSRGPVERVLGLSTLVVYTAGSRGADVAIPGLPHDEAEAMQDRVKELAIEAEGGEGL